MFSFEDREPEEALTCGMIGVEALLAIAPRADI